MTLSRPKDLTIEALVARAQQGAVSCFAELVRRFEPRLFNFLIRRVGCAADAEDLTQDTFVRAWQRIDQYNPRWCFSTWLFTIGHRLAISHRSRRRPLTNGHGPLTTAAPEADPARSIARSEQAGLLWNLADRVLTDRQRTALWLRVAEDMGTRDIARVLGTSQVVVRVTLFRARERLAQCATWSRPQIDEPVPDKQLVGDPSW